MADINGVVGIDEADPGDIVLENGGGKVVKENPGRLKKQPKGNAPGDDYVTATGTRERNAGLYQTEASDSLASAGALKIAASLAVTEADDALAGVGALAIVGALAVTEADDTVSAEGARSTFGTLDATEADDSLTGEGAVSIAGSFAATEGADSLAAEGALAIAGSLDATEADDAASGDADLLITGRLGDSGYLLAEDAANLVTEVGNRLLTQRTATVVEEDDTLAAASDLIAGALFLTEEDDTAEAAGTLAIAGTLAATEDEDALSAAAELTGEAEEQPRGNGHGMGYVPRPGIWPHEAEPEAPPPQVDDRIERRLRLQAANSNALIVALAAGGKW